MNYENLAIGSLYVGEHTEEVAVHLTKWMTGQIQKGTSVVDFKSIWNDFVTEEETIVDQRMSQVLGITRGEYWLDILDFSEGMPDELYETAVKNGADRFVTFNNNAFIDIVAIRGHPDGRDIATKVLGEENIKNWSVQDTLDALGADYLS
ncbi:hypothetical protein K8R33_03055 [archaeon]|nr:hypothetical protein [archaeon]